MKTDGLIDCKKCSLIRQKKHKNWFQVYWLSESVIIPYVFRLY